MPHQHGWFTHRIVSNVQHTQVRARLQSIQRADLIIREPQLFKGSRDILQDAARTVTKTRAYGGHRCTPTSSRSIFLIEFLARLSMRRWSIPLNGAIRSIWFVDSDSFLQRRSIGAWHQGDGFQWVTHWHSFRELSDASSLLMNTFFVSKFMPPHINISFASAATRGPTPAIPRVSCRDQNEET